MKVNTKGLDEVRARIFTYYTENPCLSQGVDYKPHNIRSRIYRRELKAMSDEDARAELESLIEEELI